jgi:hypothetical protein
LLTRLVNLRKRSKLPTGLHFPHSRAAAAPMHSEPFTEARHA